MANITVIDLNASAAWLCRSAPHLAEIERPYSGAASKNKGGISGGDADAVFRYGASPKDAERLVAILKERKFTRIHASIDVSTIAS